MIDILYLAHNRLEFTKLSLSALLENTDWSAVQLYVYADNCSDESFEWIKNTLTPHREFTSLWKTSLGSPVAVIDDYFKLHGRVGPSGPQTASIVAKIDNDFIVPPGWLEVASAILDRYPNVDLLGIEPYKELSRTPQKATYTRFDTVRHSDDCTCGLCGPECRTVQIATTNIRPIARDVILTDHIGGIGLFRRRAFENRPLPPREKTIERYRELFPGHPDSAYAYFGFTEWQWHHRDLIKAWLAPALPCFLLDHLPFEPFRSLTKQYIAHGDQRVSWGEYSEECSKLWEWRFPDWRK